MTTGGPGPDPSTVLATARRAYTSGSDREAVGLCRSVLRSLDDGPDPQPALRVRAVHLMLCAAQRWWRGPEGSAEMPVHALVDEAVATADRTGDPVLKSLSRQALGAYRIAMRGLPDGIAAYTDAVRYARASGDPVARVDALTELGHHTAGQSLPRAVELLNEAHGLLAALPGSGSADAEYRIRSGRVTGYLGVAHFDLGNFDQGERLLRQARSDLDAVGVVDLYLLISNYLAQLLIAAGRFAQGRTVLRQTLDRTPREAEPSMHLGYNLALLGKLELEAERPDVAEEPIRTGWGHLRETQHASVRPIVRNYLAELLMHPAYRGRDLAVAGELLRDTERECRTSGFLRSELTAIALRARVALLRGDLAEALELGEAAADRLGRAGELPSLRGEEIYLIHHDVLRAAGRHPAADRSLRRGYAIVSAKAATIADPALRRVFLDEVPVSAAVADAVRRYLNPPSAGPAPARGDVPDPA